MKRALAFFFECCEAFVHPSVKLLADEIRYQRFLVPGMLLFCLCDSLMFGFFSQTHLHSNSLTLFSYGASLVFICLLFLSRRYISTRPLTLTYILLMIIFFTLASVFFEPAYQLILLGRFTVYILVALLLAGRRLLQALLGVAVYLAASIAFVRDFQTFVLPDGMTEQNYVDALLVSSSLSCLLIFVLMAIYKKTCDLALDSMENQKQLYDRNRLTKEFVNLAGDMNSVMQGPIEDVLDAVRALRIEGADVALKLTSIKRASDAVYGIARSFGVLAQDQKETYMVRINLDELVRYAQIICQNNFQGLGVRIRYESEAEPLEFTGASGRWLLLLVSLMQFMGEQVSGVGGKQLLIRRQKRGDSWELILIAEGVAPFEFPYDLRQKLKEESTQELLKQTSGKAFLYLLDHWGLKLGISQPA